MEIGNAQSADDNGGYLDLLLTLGLAIFGFQMVVACLHVERWLLPELHWTLFRSQATSAAGVVLVCIALILQSVAYVSMESSWRLMATGKEPSKLVGPGPFALVTRNPIYLSSEMYIAGVFLMNGTLVFALFPADSSDLDSRADKRREEEFLFWHAVPGELQAIPSGKLRATFHDRSESLL